MEFKKKSWTIRCADPRLISRRAAISFTATRRFYFTIVSNAAIASGVTTRCAWPGRGQFVTELMPLMNFLFHSYTCCSDRHASPYWTFILRCVLQAWRPSLRYYCAVALHSCIILPPVSHSPNHKYHPCQLTRQSSCFSNFYSTFKVFIWLYLVKGQPCILEQMPLFFDLVHSKLWGTFEYKRDVD
jgi:hypothetical protein